MLQKKFQYWLARKDMDMKEKSGGGGGGGGVVVLNRNQNLNLAIKLSANGPVCLQEYNEHLLTC